MNTFGEKLNEYIKMLGCTLSELAGAAGLSASTLSRYSSGEREPRTDGDIIGRLAGAIAALAEERGMDISKEEAESGLSASISRSPYVDFAGHFDRLVSALHISLTDLARSMNFNASYLSRIRSGSRTPANTALFVENLCRYVAARCADEGCRSAFAELTGCGVSELTGEKYYEALTRWFGMELGAVPNKVDDFLKNLDAFNLDEYIRTIHFDELKVPTVPFRLPASKNYYGAEQMRQGELDFFKSTVLSKSEEPVFMCSDMPMEELAKDIEFGKKWMFAIAMTVKKGLHLNVIHNIHRPFSEMMLGLEGWIPLYMTGQVSPFYFHSAPTGLYQHLNYVSGAAALCGECISGHHADGKYYFTNNREETAYYRKKSKALLEKARPLMEIYRESDAERWEKFMSEAEAEHGARRSILSSLPLYTMDDALLDSIMSRNGLADGERRRLREFAARQRQTMEKLLKSDSVTIEISETDESEYAECPAMISVPEMFCGREMDCTYGEYIEHLRQTKRFAELHENYSVHVSDSQTFRNIQIRILEDRYVVISKNRAPAIHFVIRNRKMVDAIQGFAPVV